MTIMNPEEHEEKHIQPEPVESYILKAGGS